MSLIRVKTGQWVAEGQRLGDVGSTGYSTGNHLHFIISRWGKTVNPALLLH
jgi:murein DD-endopeptidase MepM/ murein hydrolase activator NlpD